MPTPSGPTLERPRCPTCREPVAEECVYCPGCKTPYHESCYRGEGCLVAGCSGKPATTSGRLPEEPYSPLWRGLPWLWGLVVLSWVAGLPVLSKARYDLQQAIVIVEAVVIWGTLVLTGVAFYHDYSMLPGRSDRHGTLAWACWILGTALGWALAMVGAPAAHAALSAGGVCGIGFALAGLSGDRKRSRAHRALAIGCGVGLLAAISVPGYRTSRERANSRACYANQKTLAGSLEMYNLDKATRVTVLDRAMWRALKSGGYLGSIPQDPGQGSGSSGNYQWTPGGNGMRCATHGTIQ